MGSRMPDLPLSPRMDKTLHPCWQKNNGNTKNNNPASFVKKHGCFQKHAKTKMTALARSIDLKRGWTKFNLKINSNRWTGQKIRFYHSPLMDSLQIVSLFLGGAPSPAGARAAMPPGPAPAGVPGVSPRERGWAWVSSSDPKWGWVSRIPRV